MTVASATAFSAESLSRSVAIRLFMSNAALHRPPGGTTEHFDTAQVLSLVLFVLSLVNFAEDQLDPGTRRAFTQVLWGIDGHSRSSDTHCLFRERLLDLHRHRSDRAGSYFTRASLFWPKEVRPGSARRNSSGRTGHWSKTFKIWSTTPPSLCTLSWLRSLFSQNASAAFVKVAVAGKEYTPAWHCFKKKNGVYPVVSAATVATDVSSVMAVSGLRDGETAHQLRGASSSKAVQLSDGQLKAQVLETARWSGDSQFSTSYEGFVRCWCLSTPPPASLRNPQQIQRWGIIALDGWVGKQLFATQAAHTHGAAFTELLLARVTAIDIVAGASLARRALPRARQLKDRRRLLRATFPIFTIQGASKHPWVRRLVPFAVVADGHRRWVHHDDSQDDALSLDRWC